MYTVSIKKGAIDKELKHATWMVLISNDISDAGEALLIYRQKEVVEKDFLKFKNSLDLSRLRVHREQHAEQDICGFSGSYPVVTGP
ncbi:MAG: hypothetical protein NTZ74_08875 [Chloroflexi bacterium]|nr:hypothetical protein [Chloroflexota bacterium]